MTDDTPEPSPAPETTTDDAGDRKVVPLLRPQRSQPPASAGEDDDPGPSAA
ncbi:hypothetical protein PQI07_28470 [Methylobacterium sp. 092160098-2]|uniref:hypothetical protein n=1 Tax=Methylobacterium sp. 092160098-2 TaxID=3025129 RepID=UPI0023819ED8|nr:hypothetical protein [Methylobacterium sp. 092160098-2]MDE4914601.1 hypothetical protein [Methylobacterium sp. 092160098-2]